MRFSSRKISIENISPSNYGVLVKWFVGGVEVVCGWIFYTVMVAGITYLSKSERDTKRFAIALLKKHWSALRQGALLFALYGELGAGKTTFAKGVGEYLGIKRPVRSPGYVLVTEYPYSSGETPGVSGDSTPGVKEAGKLFHIDLWRIEGAEEARALGIQRMIGPGSIILIEWAQKIPELLKELKKRDDLKVVGMKLVHRGKDERGIEVVDS